LAIYYLDRSGWGRGTQLDIPAAVALLDLQLADEHRAVLDEQPQLPMGAG